MWSEYQQGFDHFRNLSIYVMKLRKVEVTGERKNSLHISVLVYMYWVFFIRPGFYLLDSSVSDFTKYPEIRNFSLITASC